MTASAPDVVRSHESIPLTLRVKLLVRRCKPIHRPLQWLNQVARPYVIQLALRVPRRFGVGLPQGTFSALRELGSPNSQGGRMVVRDQGSPRIPNPSLLLLCKRQQHLEQPWPIFWSRHQNARLIGASLALVNERNELCEESAYGARRVYSDPAWQRMTLARPTRLAGAWTSVVSKWYANDIPQPYAHWLLDALPRLALLGEFPAETKIILPGWKRKYHVDALQMLGLAERCRWTPEKHLIVEDYYFSSPTTMVVCHNPYAVQFLRTNFLPKTPAAETPRKFFLRRTSFGRNMVNEEEVYRFFKEHGWAIVDAAGLSFLEQIQYFSNAEAVCAIHGSGTANMVWCKAGCKFVELFAADYLAGDQEWIAQCVDVDYSFMMFRSDHKLSAEVNIGELKEHLVARGMLEC